MFLPLLDFEDGYGFTYGAQLARPGVAGARSRLSFPLTWGGDRHAAVQLEKNFDGNPGMFGVLTRVETGVSISRERIRISKQTTTAIGSGFVASARSAIRSPPAARPPGSTSRSAGCPIASRSSASTSRSTRGSIPCSRAMPSTRGRPSSISIRHRDSGESNRPRSSRLPRPAGPEHPRGARPTRGRRRSACPRICKPLLGGMSNLRGFRAGTAVGDTLVAGSLEIRAPLTSPLRVGKFGVNAFVDVGTVYDKGAHLGDQTLRPGRRWRRLVFGGLPAGQPRRGATASARHARPLRTRSSPF